MSYHADMRMVASMHSVVTSYHCGCGNGGGVSVGRSGGGAESRHTAQPHNTLAT